VSLTCNNTSGVMFVILVIYVVFLKNIYRLKKICYTPSLVVFKDLYNFQMLACIGFSMVQMRRCVLNTKHML